MKKSILTFVFAAIIAVMSINVNAQTFALQGIDNPVATLSSSDANDTICDGDAVMFTAAISGGSTYEFFVNGVSVQGPGASNNYVPPVWAVGDYEVVVELDNGSCTATDTIEFAVLALPVPTLVSDAPGDIACDGDLITFTAGGGSTYDFRVDGVSVQSGASNTYATATLTDGQEVDVVVGNAGGCFATSAGVTMTINDLPAPTLVSDAPGDAACDGSTVEFTATGGVQYEFFVDGVSVQGPAASDTYSTSALADGEVVTVEVINANSCSATSAGITMTIHPLPTVVSVTGNVTSGSAVCVGTDAAVDLVGLTGTSPWSFEVYEDVAGSPGVLFYTVPGTVIDSNPTIMVPVPASGFTTLHLRIIDGNGCSTF
jgi:hypothetical protein